MNTPDNLNERLLMNKTADGDEIAFAALFHAHIDRIYTNALHFTKSPDLAKDICQEVFARVWNYRNKLAEVDSFEAWVVTITTNFIRNTLKKKVLTIENENYLNLFLADKQPGPDELLNWKEWEEQLHQAIDELPDQMRTAFKLSRFEGLSHAEIAIRMNISRVTSQNYIARALLILKKRLKEQGGAMGLVVLFFMK